MNNFKELNVEYIGKQIGESRAKIYKYYRTTMKLDGRDVTVYLRQNAETRPILFIWGWVDKDDSKADEIANFYAQSTQGYKAMPKPVQTEIDLSQVQVELPRMYYEDYVAPDSEQEAGKDVLQAKLFQMKKNLILQKRREQLLERLKRDEAEKPQLKLDNVLDGLNEAEKEQAVSLHEQMLRCVIAGKYSYGSYIEFLENLPNIARGKGYVVSEKDRTRMTNDWYAGAKKSSTYRVPGNMFIAGFCHDESRPYRRSNILDIDFGTDTLYSYNPNKKNAIENDINDEQRGDYMIGGETFYTVSDDSSTFIALAGKDGEVRYVPSSKLSIFRKIKSGLDISEEER